MFVRSAMRVITHTHTHTHTDDVKTITPVADAECNIWILNSKLVTDPLNPTETQGYLANIKILNIEPSNNMTTVHALCNSNSFIICINKDSHNL